MTVHELICLTPFLMLALAPLIIMMSIAVVRNHLVVYGFTLLAYAASFIALLYTSYALPHLMKPLFIFDGFGMFFFGLLLITGALLTILSYDYLKGLPDEKEEYYIVILVATLGAAIMATAGHFISFFLGLETLSLAVFILIAYVRKSSRSVEASIKYLMLASVAAAFLLFGMALVYLSTGDMQFSAIAPFLANANGLSPVLLTGLAMIIAGICFKLALFPFHLWIGDVYSGAPLPVAGFIATVSKGAVMALLIRFFAATGGASHETFAGLVAVIAILSMFAGNILALRQQNIKRMLAYSSIAHAGYLIVTLLIGGAEGMQAAVFYIVSYMITSVAAFGVLTVFAQKQQELVRISDLKGLFRKQPLIALVMALAMLSLAGIPLTAGFIAKFTVIMGGIQNDIWIPVSALLLNSVIGLFYYLRVTAALFASGHENTMPRVSKPGYLVLALAGFAILLIGLFPSLLLHLTAGLKLLY